MGQALSACTGFRIEPTKERAFDYRPPACTPPKGNTTKFNTDDGDSPSPAVLPLKDDASAPETIALQHSVPWKQTDLCSESRSPPAVVAEKSLLIPSTDETDIEEREGVAETFSVENENVEPEVKILSKSPPWSTSDQVRGEEELDVSSDKQLKPTKTDEFVAESKKPILKDEGETKSVEDATKSASEPPNPSISTSPTSVSDQISCAGATLSPTTKSPPPKPLDQDAQRTLETGDKDLVKKESALSTFSTAEKLTMYRTEAFHVLSLHSPTVMRSSKTSRSTHVERKQKPMQTPTDSAGTNAGLCIYPTGKFSVLGLKTQEPARSEQHV